MGDTYAGSGNGAAGKIPKNSKQTYLNETKVKSGKVKDVKNKSLCQIPNRFAIGMTDRGWILRNENIWYKPNQMPNSAKDRFTVDFEGEKNQRKLQRGIVIYELRKIVREFF